MTSGMLTASAPKLGASIGAGYNNIESAAGSLTVSGSRDSGALQSPATGGAPVPTGSALQTIPVSGLVFQQTVVSDSTNSTTTIVYIAEPELTPVAIPALSQQSLALLILAVALSALTVPGRMK
ncbi:MAG: hypothetical protein ACK5ME_10125 [Parahaliea sp.]